MNKLVFLLSGDSVSYEKERYASNSGVGQRIGAVPRETSWYDVHSVSGCERQAIWSKCSEPCLTFGSL